MDLLKGVRWESLVALLLVVGRRRRSASTGHSFSVGVLADVLHTEPDERHLLNSVYRVITIYL
jgi:hypothetical protein